ncbi:MAG: response regulator, partial [Chloroflexota bacterium]|nr:response regulator [Chloroflexota bacterium]
ERQAAQIERKNEELKEQSRRAEEASRMKSEFLANMSHELRTPLNAIIGFSEVLLDPELNNVPEDQHTQFLENIHRSGRHLLGLINDILDLSKVEAGRMELHPEMARLSELIRGCVAIVQPLAIKKQVDLRATCQPDNAGVLVDVARFKQILYNLLSNAVKFTPEGGQVDVAAQVIGSEARVAVRDTGIGIKPEDQDLIFEEFRQVAQGPARQQEGTGLGLALVRRLVELHGGRIWVESAPGAGSCFTFTLPAQPDAREPVATPAKATKPTPEAPLVQPRQVTGLPVLVVEDDQEAARLITLHLARAGYEVHRASTADEAMEVARRLHPFAVTLDVLLPGQDGWDILTALKSDPETQDIAVIMVTVVDDRELGFALGATDYIVKPLNRDALLGALKRVDGRRRGTRKLVVLVVDDDPADRQLLTSMLEKADCEVLLAENGMAGVHLARTESVDIVVLDLIMPGMNGFEVVRELRQSPETASLPIVICTAKELTPEERAELNGYVESIVGKSAEMTDLLSELLQLERFYPRLAGIVGGETGHAISGHFVAHLERELSRAARHDRPFCLIAVQVQHGGERNEQLRDTTVNLCGLFSKRLRRYDLVAYDEEGEILVLLPEIGSTNAHAVLTALQAIASAALEADHALDPHRLAMGFASFPEDAGTASQLLGVARGRLTTKPASAATPAGEGRT